MANKIAGIDVHKKVLMVVVMDPVTPDEKPERRRFCTMPTEFRSYRYSSPTQPPPTAPTTGKAKNRHKEVSATRTRPCAYHAKDW